MPEDLVRQEVRSLNLTQWPSLYRLAEAFGVTISALVVRLKELGLIFDVVERIVLLQDPSLKTQTNLF
jgi:Zn-dependent peptidase ImmA (M78 family)